MTTKFCWPCPPPNATLHLMLPIPTVTVFARMSWTSFFKLSLTRRLCSCIVQRSAESKCAGSSLSSWWRQECHSISILRRKSKTPRALLPTMWTHTTKISVCLPSWRTQHITSRSKATWRVLTKNSWRTSAIQSKWRSQHKTKLSTNLTSSLLSLCRT